MKTISRQLILFIRRSYLQLKISSRNNCNLQMKFHKKLTLFSVLATLLMFNIGCESDETKLDETEIETRTEVDYKPILSYDMENGNTGDKFLNWTRSVFDDSRSISGNKSIKISTKPGDVLPNCSGSHRFAGRTLLDEKLRVPPGKIIWIRMMQYIPSTFSFGYKYGGEADRDEATACGQNKDGNSRVKWMVISPTEGTGRVYFNPQAYRRSLGDGSGTMRIITEFKHGLTNLDVTLPRDKWFSLQMAVKISSKSDGFIRAWIDDSFLGEMNGPTMSPGSSVKDWGIGDYWNGVPWTDGEAGRTDFWIDDIIIASYMDSNGTPNTLDDGGRPYISSKTRVSDF